MNVVNPIRALFYQYKLEAIAPSTEATRAALRICEVGASAPGAWPVVTADIPTLELLATVLPAAAAAVNAGEYGDPAVMTTAQYQLLMSRAMRRRHNDLDGRLQAAAARICAAGPDLTMSSLIDVATLRCAAQIGILDSFETPAGYFGAVETHLGESAKQPTGLKDALLLASTVSVRLQSWCSTVPARHYKNKIEQQAEKMRKK
ncbi:hypothetical protein HK101_004051, partial [Irineochytrium annulatum]